MSEVPLYKTSMPSYPAYHLGRQLLCRMTSMTPGHAARDRVHKYHNQPPAAPTFLRFISPSFKGGGEWADGVTATRRHRGADKLPEIPTDAIVH